MDLLFGHSDLTIVYTSREFQPRADLRRAVPVRRPVRRPEGRGSAIPLGGTAPPGGGVRLARDALQHRGRVLPGLFRGAGGEDCQVVLSTGSDVGSEDIGRPPPNFLVQPYVPQLEVLRRAAAFVTHGGMNSVSESLSFGVPVVVVPQMGEQEIVGRRVEQLGAGPVPAQGRRHGRGPPSGRPAGVPSDESYRQQAAQVGETFRAAGGVRRAADAILAFTRGSRPPRDQTASSPTLQTVMAVGGLLTTRAPSSNGSERSDPPGAESAL